VAYVHNAGFAVREMLLKQNGGVTFALACISMLRYGLKISTIEMNLIAFKGRAQCEVKFQ
jgi:hypothetical protein